MTFYWELDREARNEKSELLQLHMGHLEPPQAPESEPKVPERIAGSNLNLSEKMRSCPLTTTTPWRKMTSRWPSCTPGT